MEELQKTVANMEAYGGSFVKALAEAMRRADSNNLNKIVKAFPELMEEYNPLKWKR